MKLVFLMYLEEDDALVMKGFKELGVAVFSRLPLEGHGAGAEGWYGEVAPYRSQMVFAVLSDNEASRLLDAVAGWPAGQDPRHPVRACQVDVEKAVSQTGVVS